MYHDTKKNQFTLLNSASGNVAAGADAFGAGGLTPDVNTYVLSYPTACRRSNKPADDYCYPFFTGDGSNYAVLQFLLNDTAGDAVENMTAAFSLWGWSPGMSGGVLLLTVALTAGTAVLGTAAAPGMAPVPGVTLTGQWGYVDYINLSANNIGAWAKPDAGADGIAQLFIDPKGLKWLFGDWDCDGGGGTACDDGMAIIREY